MSLTSTPHTYAAVIQAERLMYLRLHPLMAGLELRDLEAASEVLGLAFFPPGGAQRVAARVTST